MTSAGYGFSSLNSKKYDDEENGAKIQAVEDQINQTKEDINQTKEDIVRVETLFN